MTGLRGKSDEKLVKFLRHTLHQVHFFLKTKATSHKRHSLLCLLCISRPDWMPELSKILYLIKSFETGLIFWYQKAYWERWLCLPKGEDDVGTKLLTRKFPPPPLDVPFRLRLPLLPPSPAPSTLLPLQSVAAALTADSLCLTLCRSRLNRWRQMTITSYWSQHRQDRQLRQWHNHSTTHFHDSSTSTWIEILNSLLKISIL